MNYPTAKQKKPKKTKGLGAGIIAFGVVFALFSVIFKPHSIGAFILATALSGLIGAIVKVMGEGLDLTVKPTIPESLKNMSEDTGNPEVDELLFRGRDLITQISTEKKRIPDASLKAKLDQLEKQCADIFQAVYNNPKKAPQIRRFMDYYLPTTLKLVTGFRIFDERNMSGAETVAAKQRIEEALGVVLKGCQKMLDTLYRDDVLDIKTDIDVLEQMLKRDGLTESDLTFAAIQAKQAAQIDQAANAAMAVKSQAGDPLPARPSADLAQPALNQPMADAAGAMAQAQRPKE